MLPGIAASVAACDVGGMIVEVTDRRAKSATTERMEDLRRDTVEPL